MRGKDQLYPVKLLPDGITPAYAGKSIIHHSGTFVKRITPAYAGKRWSDHSCLGIF